MATVAQHSPSFSAFSPLLQEQALRHWQRLLALAPQYDALPEPTTNQYCLTAGQFIDNGRRLLLLDIDAAGLA